MTQEQAHASGGLPEREEVSPAVRSPTNADPPLASAAHSNSSALDGARLWYLPTAGGAPWMVSQEPDPARLARMLAETPPVFVSSGSHAAAPGAGFESGWREVDARWAERMQESIFEFAKRLLLGLAWVAVGLAGLRIPGEIKYLDGILLLLGFGFLGYTFVRYGSAAWNWMRWRSQARATFLRATQVASPLFDRLTQALELRKSLSLEERGHRPDEELSDADAYRGLIRAGLTTPRELSALGRAVAARLGLPEGAPGELKITELVQRAGLDPLSVLFYLDLVSAAKQIGPDGDAVEML